MNLSPSLRSLVSKSLRTIVIPLVIAGVASSISGCTMTVNAVNPHPSVTVGANAGPFAIDTSAVKDDYDPNAVVTIHEFRKTLENGFRNTVGERLAAKGDVKAVRLVMREVSMEMSSIGNVGSFLLIRYRGKWVGADGNLIADVAGTAKPRNVTETGPRHLEDAVEVMFEQIVSGLDRSRSGS